MYDLMRCTNAGSMLARCLRRRPNIDPTLVQCLMFTGVLLHPLTYLSQGLPVLLGHFHGALNPHRGRDSRLGDEIVTAGVPHTRKCVILTEYGHACAVPVIHLAPETRLHHVASLHREPAAFKKICQIFVSIVLLQAQLRILPDFVAQLLQVVRILIDDVTRRVLENFPQLVWYGVWYGGSIDLLA